MTKTIDELREEWHAFNFGQFDDESLDRLIDEAVEAAQLPLRKYLWLNHGHGIPFLYGDDGEMQCQGPHGHVNGIAPFWDFRTAPLDDLMKVQAGYLEDLNKIIKALNVEVRGLNAQLATADEACTNACLVRREKADLETKVTELEAINKEVKATIESRVRVIVDKLEQLIARR